MKKFNWIHVIGLVILLFVFWWLGYYMGSESLVEKKVSEVTEALNFDQIVKLEEGDVAYIMTKNGELQGLVYEKADKKRYKFILKEGGWIPDPSWPEK